MRIESYGSAKAYFPTRSRGDIVEQLENAAAALRDRVRLTPLVLFGSYARGDETAASDVDVLAVVEGDPHRDSYATIHDVLSKGKRIERLELHLYTVDEAAENRSVIERMTRGGIEIDVT